MHASSVPFSDWEKEVVKEVSCQGNMVSHKQLLSPGDFELMLHSCPAVHSAHAHACRAADQPKGLAKVPGG